MSTAAAPPAGGSCVASRPCKYLPCKSAAFACSRRRGQSDDTPAWSRLFVDPGFRQRGQELGLAGAAGQAEAVRPVGEHVHGVRDAAGRECRGEAVGVFGRDVGVLRGVPDGERW